MVTRKNARGSHNHDSAQLAATIWTVTATIDLAGLNVLTWLTASLDACGRNGGRPLTGPEPAPTSTGSSPGTPPPKIYKPGPCHHPNPADPTPTRLTPPRTLVAWVAPEALAGLPIHPAIRPRIRHALDDPDTPLVQ